MKIKCHVTSLFIYTSNNLFFVHLSMRFQKSIELLTGYYYSNTDGYWLNPQLFDQSLFFSPNCIGFTI